MGSTTTHLATNGRSPHPITPQPATSVPIEVMEQAFAEAGRLGIPVGTEVIVLDQSLTYLLLHVTTAGGTWSNTGDLTEWKVLEHMTDPIGRASDIRAMDPDLLLEGPSRGMLYHAAGLFRVEWQGTSYVIAGCSAVALKVVKGVRDGPMMASGARCVLFGPSRKRLVALLNALRTASKGPRITLHGGPFSEASPPEVTEEDIVLPTGLKQDLLTWLDRFWQLGEVARERRLPLRRGLLLIGDPGTGKTQFIRHLLWRYHTVPAHLFVASKPRGDDPFGSMLAQVRGEPSGSIVVLEDIDRLADSGAVTTEYLLNCLDGLLEIENPVLWVATANDPSKLESNLLRRPGRFDRTVVFELPRPAERRRLVKQFATLPLTEDHLDRVVRDSDRLSGAHLRQAVASATLAVCGGGGELGDLLVAEIGRLQRELEAVARFREGLTTCNGIGFGSSHIDSEKGS